MATSDAPRRPVRPDAPPGRAGAGRAHVDDDVVDGGASAGPHFEGLEPPVFRQVRRDLEELVVERAARRDRVVLLHREDGVRLAHPPSVGELRRRRQILRIAFRRSTARPLEKNVLVSLGQTAIVHELGVRRIVGVPWRHRAVLHLRGDRPCVRPRVLIRKERHRADLSGAVTVRAILVKDRRDVFVECRGGLGTRRHRISDETRYGESSDRACHTFLWLLLLPDRPSMYALKR